jgi:tetratricopeptide (TPR) repeat protein
LLKKKHLSPEDKKALYAIGHALYQDKQYAEAVSFFGFLSLYEPANPIYYAAVAAYRKVLKQYSEVIYQYRLASLVEPDEAKQLGYVLKMIACHIANGDITVAIQVLKQLFVIKLNYSPTVNLIKKAARNWPDVLR